MELMIGAGVVGVFVVVVAIAVLRLRVVVPTEDVHIVQRSRKTMSYGKDQEGGNTYYGWPEWIPVIGVVVSELPVSVFDIDLDGYAGYDKGRVPFEIDVMAFFRIFDTNVAAQRVSSFDELSAQLKGVLQGACRSILASVDIEEILGERSKFGDLFTKEVDDNLKAWGVHSVKCIELMDIRDVEGSKVIHNIMAKKQSLIERESRVEVAENLRAAQEAEIVAQRAIEMQKQDAMQQIGQRSAEKDKLVGIANQQAQQEIKAQEKVTTEKQMAVVQVQEVRKAEIARDVQVVAAEQQKRTQIIRAEAEKQQTITVAEGNLEQAKLQAQGVKVEGEARGAAEQAVLMAPVNSQIQLAREIGANASYQTYLVSIRTIEKEQAVGIEQAKALTAAEIKVIANSGGVVDGVKNVMDLFTSKGGTQLGAMVEAFTQTEAGKQLINGRSDH